MNEQQQRMVEDLVGMFRGELRFDPLTLSMYVSDASLYEIRPWGVAYPRQREDVVALAKYCLEQKIPIIARGAGTSLTGAPLGGGLIVDFSRHMHAVESIDGATVRVQAGIVHSRLNEFLKPYGRYFPPDPSNTAVTTIGGMMAVDSAGSHAVRVGSTRDHVRSIECVLADGTTFEAGVELVDGAGELAGDWPESLPPQQGAEGHTIPNGDRKRWLVNNLARLLAEHGELIQKHQPPLIRNSSGYYLRNVLSQNELSLNRLLIGSEGTLALSTSAVLHTAPLPAQRGVVLMLFDSMEGAIRVANSLVSEQPSACDLLDRRLLSLGRDGDPELANLIPGGAEAALIVEQTGYSERQTVDRLRRVISAARSREPGVFLARQATDEAGVEQIWSLPRRVVPLLSRLKGDVRAMPLVEDVAVPPENLTEYLVRAQRVFQKHQVTSSLYSHVLSGQVHQRIFMAAPTAEEGPRLEAIARDLYEVALSVGGTISGEHGDGLSRTAFLRTQYGPLYRVFQQVKKLFDPENQLNPGKIISDEPHLTIQNFRALPRQSVDVTQLELRWTPAEIEQTAARCNGCGVCKSQESILRMCPFFRLDAVEEASPRSKANIFRQIVTGQLNMNELQSPEMKRLSNLCFNCKQCEVECPSNVNIPHLMIEARAQYVANHGLSRTDWILSRAHSFGHWGTRFSRTANWILGSPTMRVVLEKILGIARQRKLPPFARRTFLHWAARNLPEKPISTGPRKSVVYFVDHYANFHDPQLGRALIRILHHHNIDVHVPPEQVASGMAMISAGDLGAARKLAEKNIRVLAGLAREGHTILCTEPAAALCLKYEYPRLLDHPDLPMISERVLDAGTWLRQLSDEKKLKPVSGVGAIRAGYHTPCHTKRLTQGGYDTLLGLIPDLHLHRIEEGCSGMAGAFGLTLENFQTSLRIGWGLMTAMRESEFDIGITECSSCKLQMEQGTTTPTVHPLKLLAMAHGLMPELADKLRPSTRKLIVT